MVFVLSVYYCRLSKKDSYVFVYVFVTCVTLKQRAVGVCFLVCREAVCVGQMCCKGSLKKRKPQDLVSNEQKFHKQEMLLSCST